MARRKKNYTLDEQLQMITTEIKSTEENLKNLKQMEKDIKEQIKMRRLEELDVLISSSGMSFDEVKTILVNG